MLDVKRTVGRYEVLRELGRGGMAVVYLACQGDLDRRVAIKELGSPHASPRGHLYSSAAQGWG